MKANRARPYSKFIRDLEISPALHVCRNMRHSCRKEVYPLQHNENPDYLAMEIIRNTTFGFTIYDPEIFQKKNRYEPVIICGLQMVAPSVGSVYFIATDKLTAKGWAVCTALFQDVFDLVFEQGAKRIEMLVLEENVAGKLDVDKWYEKIGFQVEAVQGAKGKNGENYIMYVQFPAEPKEDSPCAEAVEAERKTLSDEKNSGDSESSEPSP